MLKFQAEVFVAALLAFSEFCLVGDGFAKLLGSGMKCCNLQTDLTVIFCYLLGILLLGLWSYSEHLYFAAVIGVEDWATFYSACPFGPYCCYVLADLRHRGLLSQILVLRKL